MANNNRFSVFIDWKDRLLARHGLRWPDGRALYLYRLTKAEFDELEQLLAQWLARLLVQVNLSDLPRLSGFSCLFVLYAAEWWRRKYDGAHWSWEPILRDIGANPDEWTQAQRSDCVLLGLQDWKLKPREYGGLRFLGSVAVQGGLPLNLLAEARGRIGQLLGQVLRQAGNSSVTPSDLLIWVRSLKGNLQKSYQQEVILTLLADMAWTVLRLKDEAGLTSSADAIARLDQRIPGWRDRFPLPVEDAHAQGLIEQLIRDAASIRIERNALCLPVERQLEPSEGGEWTLRSNLNLPDSAPANVLARLFRLNVDELPGFGELALTAGTERLKTLIRRMAGRDSYRLERKPWGFEGDTAVQEHVLHLSAPDGRVWSANAPRGEAVDEELPWVFSAEESGYRFLRQGSGGVATIEAMVALPPDGTIKPQAGAEATPQGALQCADRQVFHIRGAVETHDATGLACRIRTGQAGSGDDSYEWRGERYWLDFENPPMAFRGMPRLYRIFQDGMVHPMEGSLGWSPLGNPTPGLTQPIGPVSLRYPAVGEVKQRARIVVLPGEASLSMEPRDARSGVIRLQNWGAMTARVLSPSVRHTANRVHDALMLSISVPVEERVPEWIKAEVFWPHTTVPVRLNLPFPGRGVRAFNADGKEIQSGALIAAQGLIGMRLLVLAGQQNSLMTLEMAVGNGSPARVHRLRALPGALSVEVRLQDFSTDIQHLLSEDDRPDAWVRVSLRLGGVQHFVLNVARYAATLDKNSNDISLDAAGCQALAPEEIASLPVLALRLERPGDEAIVLSHRVSEGVPVGSWAFSPETREPGSWLIYPAPDSQLPFRPTLWTAPGQVDSDSPLARAIGIPNQAEREAALDEVIESMASDFLEPCWIEVERTAGQIGHLPLATLDIWRRLARSPMGMAALAFRFGSLPNGFLARFAQELPFIWEFVPFVAWRQAMARLQDQCKASFGKEAGAVIFKSYLDSRIKDMASAHGALDYLLGIASADFVPEATRDAQLLKQAVGPTAGQRLFDGETSLLMRLRRHHANDKWPTGFNSLLRQFRSQQDVVRYLCPQSQGFVDGAINMPLLLATQVATNQIDRWFDDRAAIHALRAHRAFDPEWFNEAYNLTIARCLADGLLA